MTAWLLAQLSDLSPMGIVVAWNACLTSALAIIYRDCRKDRAELWRTIRKNESGKE